MEGEPIDKEMGMPRKADDSSVPMAKRTRMNTCEASMDVETSVATPATLPNEDEVLVQVIMLV